MYIPTNFAVCLKLALKKFVESKQDATDENLDNVVTQVFNNVVFASVITRNELIETLVIKGIDREFVNKHIDTLLKIEAINFKDITVVPQHRFLKDCIDLMDKWFFQSKDNPCPFYKEVRHDYFDTDSECWVIDAWRTDDDDEEGVAPIEVYLDGSLKIRDENAFGFAICELNIIEAIEETIKQIQSENKG